MKTLLNQTIEFQNVKFKITKVEDCYDYTSIEKAVLPSLREMYIDKLIKDAFTAAADYIQCNFTRQCSSGKCITMKRYDETYVRHANGDMIFVFKKID